MASTNQSIESIQSAIDDFLKGHLNTDTGAYQITPAQLDRRLQLALCNKPLQVFTQSGEIKPGRNTIGVRCTAEKGWTIYSAVTIKSFEQVVVIQKPLRRNETISIEHLARQSRETSNLPTDYISDPEQAIGKQATRNLTAGSVLSRQHYTALMLIKRGDRVSIQSARNGLLISATGLAMSDGSAGQVINVKNISSQRVVQGTVTNGGLVSVNF